MKKNVETIKLFGYLYQVQWSEITKEIFDKALIMIEEDNTALIEELFEVDCNFEMGFDLDTVNFKPINNKINIDRSGWFMNDTGFYRATVFGYKNCEFTTPFPKNVDLDAIVLLYKETECNIMADNLVEKIDYNGVLVEINDDNLVYGSGNYGESLIIEIKENGEEQIYSY